MNIPSILEAIDEQIAKLQQVRELISDSGQSPPPSGKRRVRAPRAGKAVEASPAGKRTMSAEGRARIAAAQKKRWAENRTKAV